MAAPELISPINNIMLRNLLRSNTAYFVPIQITLTLLLIGAAVWGDFAWTWWLAGVGMYFLTGCLGVTVTFHRGLTHRSYRTHRFLEYLFSFFGCMGGTGSGIGWVAVHRQHHANSDRPGDPHSPLLSGWRVLFPNYDFKWNKWPIRDLITDPVHLAMHEYYFGLIALWAVFLTLLAGVEGFIFLWAMPIVLQVWSSVISNYGNHSPNWPGSYQNFNTRDRSVNSLPLALITWGEGWHNNHHRFPGSYTFQQRWWELDPTAWVISIIRTDR